MTEDLQLTVTLPAWTVEGVAAVAQAFHTTPERVLPDLVARGLADAERERVRLSGIGAPQAVRGSQRGGRRK